MGLEAGAGKDEEQRKSFSPLSVAACNGHMGVLKILVDSKADLNMSKQDGSTPLLIAACNGKAEVVRFLCEARAEVNKTSTQGLTPLRAATMQGHEEIKECLIAAGAVMDPDDSEERTGAEEPKCTTGGDSALTCCSGIGKWARAHRRR